MQYLIIASPYNNNNNNNNNNNTNLLSNQTCVRIRFNSFYMIADRFYTDGFYSITDEFYSS